MDEVWYGKILSKRPHFAKALAVVERTLTAPRQVNDDRFFDDREGFPREDMLPAPDGWSIVKVVVQFSGGGGRVVMAFAVFNGHPDERCRWVE